MKIPKSALNSSNYHEHRYVSDVVDIQIIQPDILANTPNCFDLLNGNKNFFFRLLTIYLTPADKTEFKAKTTNLDSEMGAKSVTIDSVCCRFRDRASFIRSEAIYGSHVSLSTRFSG